ncbi:MAG: hypothetical protein KKE73_11930 [Proteobacteria bacterium]|nr:hypothetical protein [Pseudomonadota bacterium]
MSEELTLESLELKKDLNKMTQKELRELCIEKITQITGASGMTKEELLPAIKEVLGIEEEEVPKSPYKEQIFASKQEINALRSKKSGTTERAQREIIRKKINKLKKRTRRLASANA